MRGSKIVFKLISTSLTNPKDPSKRREQGKIPHNIGLLFPKKFLAFLTKTIIILAFFGFSFQANAGLFSFLDGLFGSKTSENEPSSLNSQTVSLLEATNSSGNDAVGGGDITIINQNSLLPDSGPLGTIADIQNKKPSQDQISIYVVRQGDNLSQIAEMFGVSVNTIFWANDLKRGDLIRVGQTLIILPVSGVQYTVEKGDTIQSIAKKLKGDADEIIEFNGLSENYQLTLGEIIIVPDGQYGTPTQTSSYSSQPVKGTSNVSYVGYYMRPIEGGRRSQGLHGYNAVDLANSCGTPIMASASGDVIISRSSGWNAGYGNYIVISHANGTQTLYAHLSKVIVSTGWHVVKGQVIGYVGATGRTTGCHVHFEIRGAKNPF